MLLSAGYQASLVALSRGIPLASWDQVVSAVHAHASGVTLGDATCGSAPVPARYPGREGIEWMLGHYQPGVPLALGINDEHCIDEVQGSALIVMPGRSEAEVPYSLRVSESVYSPQDEPRLEKIERAASLGLDIAAAVMSTALNNRSPETRLAAYLKSRPVRDLVIKVEVFSRTTGRFRFDVETLRRKFDSLEGFTRRPIPTGDLVPHLAKAPLRELHPTKWTIGELALETGATLLLGIRKGHLFDFVDFFSWSSDKDCLEAVQQDKRLSDIVDNPALDLTLTMDRAIDFADPGNQEAAMSAARRLVESINTV